MNLSALSQKFSEGKNLGFAAVRLPDAEDIYFFYATQKPRMERLELGEAGRLSFVFSPYGASNMAYRLHADAVYCNEVLLAGDGIPQPLAAADDTETRPANFCADQAFYEQYVERCVQEIRDDKMDKLVAARCERVELPADFDAAHYFSQLAASYTNACVYYFNVPGTGCWMGATPERLLEAGNGRLATVALAGTLPADSDAEWTQKEKDEQAITEHFIELVFAQNKISDYRKTAVSEIPAGKLKHLYSSFSWKPGEEALQQKFHKILSALNPTPAVCGMPQFDAFTFIAHHEKLERRFYTGFIGLCDGSSANLFVNLRCMELGDGAAWLYAGAGITEDSKAAAEWEETARKMDTLKRFLA